MKRCRFENVGFGVFTNYVGLERLLHRRQLLHRPRRSEAPDRLERRLLGAVRRRRGPEVSADDGVVHRSPAVRPGPRRRLQLRRQLPRRHRHRDLRQSRTARMRSTARTIRRASIWDRRPVAIDFYNNYMTNFHDNAVRDRRQHAQRPRDAEHDGQLGVAPVLQPAGDRRADLLDPQHRLSRAGRIDAADERIGGRALLQQHDPDGDRRPDRRRTCTGATT